MAIFTASVLPAESFTLGKRWTQGILSRENTWRRGTKKTTSGLNVLSAIVLKGEGTQFTGII